MEKRIIMVAPVAPFDALEGNSSRIRSIVDGLERHRFNVSFMLINLYSSQYAKTRERFRQSGFCVTEGTARPPEPSVWQQLIRKCKVANRWFMPVHKVDDWIDAHMVQQFTSFLKEQNPCLVWINYVFCSRLFLSIPHHIPKVLDTHDIFADRHLVYLNYGIEPTYFYTTRKEECKGLLRADRIVAIQEQEARILHARTGRAIDVIKHRVFIDARIAAPYGPPRALFVGSGNIINKQTAKRLMGKILPRIRSAIPEFELMIAGRICSRLQDQLGVVKCGVVADMATACAAGRLMVNPISFGTGLKIKNIEALGYGLPVVTTSAGAEGLEEAVAAGVVLKADTDDALCRCVISLLQNRRELERRSRLAIEFASNWNQEQDSALDRVISECLPMA